MISTNYEQLYIEGSKSGSAIIKLTSPTPISVKLTEHSTNLNGTVTVNITGNNTKSVSVNLSYSNLYVNGETYSATVVATTNDDGLSIPIVVNCSDTLIYLDINEDNGKIITFTSLPEVNSLKLIKNNDIVNVTSKIQGTENRIRTASFTESELEDVNYIIASNGLSQIAVEHSIEAPIIPEPDNPEPDIVPFQHEITSGLLYKYVDDDIPMNYNVYFDDVLLEEGQDTQYAIAMKDNPQVKFDFLDDTVNAYHLFFNCEDLSVVGEINKPITNIEGCFWDCDELNDITEMGNWDIPETISVTNLFTGCQNLTSISPLSNWGNRKISSSDFAFYGCYKLTDISPISNWDFSEVTDLTSMFFYCRELGTVPYMYVPNVIDTGRYMFGGCTKLTNLGGFGGLKASISFEYSPLLTHQSLMNVINNLATVTDSPTLKFHTDSLTKLSDDEIMIAINKGWNVDGYEPDNPEPDYSTVIYRYKNTGDNTIKLALKHSKIIQAAGGVLVSRSFDVVDLNVIDAYTGEEYELFEVYGDHSSSSALNDFTFWAITSERDFVDVRLKITPIYKNDGGAHKEVAAPYGMLFYKCDIYDVIGENWALPEVDPNWWAITFPSTEGYDFSSMFYDSAMTKVYIPTVIGNESQITHGAMFAKCDNLTNLSGSEYVIPREGMFLSCHNLTDISAASTWRVEDASNISYLFYGCTSLTDLSPLKDWNVSNIKYAGDLFSYCTSLTDLSPLKDWKWGPTCKSLWSLFFECTSLTDLSPLKDWNVSSMDEMHYTFSYCTSLTDLSPLKDWNVSSMKTLDHVFNQCNSLTNIDGLTHWDVSNVTVMYGIFEGCHSLVDLSPLSNWNTSNVVDFKWAFSPGYSNNSSLTTIPLLDFSSATDTNMMLYNCVKLRDLKGFKNLKCSLDLSSSSLLTHESLMNVINNLATVTNSPTLALHADSLAKLTDAEIAIAINKGWIVS